MVDLEALRHLPETSGAPLTVSVRDGFTTFAAWAHETHGLARPGALLAGFAAGALGRDLVVAVEDPASATTYAATRQLGAVAESTARPEMTLRDLRLGVPDAFGHATGPVLSVLKSGDGLTVTVTNAAPALNEADTLRLLTNLAARLEQPLRHLL